MSQLKKLLWYSSTGLDISEFSNQLEGSFSLAENQQWSAQSLDILDDYDRHIWLAGGLLLKRGTDYELQLPGRVLTDKVSAGAAFYWEFSAGVLKNELAKLIEFRALQNVVTLRLKTAVWDIRDLDEGKVVCRITEMQLGLDGATDSPVGGYLVLHPLRGYQKAFKKVSAALELQMGSACESDQADLRALIKAQQIDLAIPVSQKAVIAYADASEVAVRHMIHTTLLDAQRHIPGICDDIDSEFLHDFRVQVRKARSLVQLMKKSLPSETRLELKTLLADIARPTGPLRDLDVFLLDQEKYRNLLPASHYAGFDQLTRNIRSARTQALKRVKTYISGDDYQGAYQRVNELLEQMPVYELPVAEQPVGEVVAGLIEKRYRKICRLGLAIDDNTADEAVHDLRIECKKLRYLLSLFGELFPKAPQKKIIKRMKALQSVLGNFNDYAVQQAFLTEQGNRSRSQALIIAVSGLVAVLHQKQREARSHVCEGMAAFAAPETARQIQLLLNGEE